jgi:hypothetical protein
MQCHITGEQISQVTDGLQQFFVNDTVALSVYGPLGQPVKSFAVKQVQIILFVSNF